MKKYNSYSLLEQKCEECNKKQNEVKGDFSNPKISSKFFKF